MPAVSRTRRVLVVFALALLVQIAPAAAQKLGSVPRVAPSPSAPRGEVLEWTSKQGQPYWYRLPKKMNKRRPPCLVFMLHGTGLNHGWSFWNYPIARGTFRKDDIVVSPDGLTPGGGKTFNFVQGKKDGEQIAGLIALFKKQFPVGRVYLYGHSQGAFFCYWFAGEYPERVDGIVAHAGNVLSVKHGKLAKEKVAIGILHGKADAVVPVSCAYRTERIYKEQGYKHVKLYVVEGLTKRSGHWPLPTQVAEMFAWLDQVSVATPGGALDVAIAELGKDAPDFAVVAEAVRRARSLLKGYRGEDRGVLAEKHAALREFVEGTAAAQVLVFSLTGQTAKDDQAVAVAYAYFRRMDDALADTAAWKKGMRKLQGQRKKHDKTVAKALRSLAKRASRKSFGAGLKALQTARLSTSFGDLRDQMVRTAESPPKGVKDTDLAALRTITESSREAEAEARKQSDQVMLSQVKTFREAHPDWFEAGE